MQLQMNSIIQMITLVILALLYSDVCLSQTVYKTPSGEKYHTKHCRHIENTNHNMTMTEAITKYGLSPCSQCNPPYNPSLTVSKSSVNDDYKCESQQCKGYAKTTKTRCRHSTRNCNGYCANHDPTNNSRIKQGDYRVDNRLGLVPSIKKATPSNRSSINTYVCGAMTKTGGNCKRKVKGGGYCYQHK